MTFGVQQGILTGVVVSLLMIVVRTTRPHYAVLGRIPDTTFYRNVARHSQAKTFPGILLYVWMHLFILETLAF